MDDPVPRYMRRKQVTKLRCPAIDGDFACEGCTCVTPCAVALQKLDQVIEEVNHGAAEEPL